VKDALVDPTLSLEERALLARGIAEWGGSARCTQALAVAMGFASVADLLEGEGQRIWRAIAAHHPLSRADWRRALFATEIVFASDVAGSGVDWPTVSGLDDTRTIVVLRELQRKLARL